MHYFPIFWPIHGCDIPVVVRLASKSSVLMVTEVSDALVSFLPSINDSLNRNFELSYLSKCPFPSTVLLCNLRDGLGEVFWLLLQTHLLSLFPPFLGNFDLYHLSRVIFLLENTDLILCLI